jgi:hypothetical protein
VPVAFVFAVLLEFAPEVFPLVFAAVLLSLLMELVVMLELPVPRVAAPEVPIPLLVSRVLLAVPAPVSLPVVPVPVSLRLQALKRAPQAIKAMNFFISNAPCAWLPRLSTPSCSVSDRLQSGEDLNCR